ncbi:MAG: 4-(cytidine 5'-diphospho)-2-C-methyl-D-erythritol kinase [Oscillospiraceae bacterium]
MVNSVTVRTPAKINLSLDIVGKRTDGYHFLKTIMQSVSIYDEVNIRLNNDENITVLCDVDGIPLDGENTAVKAAEAFFAQTKTERSGVEISIKKNIPVKAGLGGGSADAAAVLVGLNELYKTDLTSEQLCNIGINVGADVPFCIVGGTVLAEGIGEILMPLPDLENYVLLVAKPTEGVSTAEAYKKFDEVVSVKRPDHDEMIAAIAVGDTERVPKLCCNVLESASSNSDTEKIKEIMNENNALCSVMSGSGSAVFGIFEKKRFAAAAQDDLQKFCEYTEICSPVEKGAEIL